MKFLILDWTMIETYHNDKHISRKVIFTWKQVSWREAWIFYRNTFLGLYILFFIIYWVSRLMSYILTLI